MKRRLRLLAHVRHGVVVAEEVAERPDLADHVHGERLVVHADARARTA